MKIVVAIVTLCLSPFALVAQIGVADPVTGNAAINFYGRVVDQDGKPLIGAKVTMSVLVGYVHSPAELGMRDDKTTLATDANGYFALLNARGHSVKIESIEKEGYELSRTISRLYLYSWSAGVAHPDSEKPVLFVLWQKEKKASWISGDKYFEFIPDERPYAVDLKKRKITQATNSEGDFQFWLVRPKGAGKRTKFDWSFSFRSEEGNFLQATDQGFFEMIFPPPNGYTNAYEETYQVSQGLWQQGGRKQFYVKMREGHSYGKIALAWDAVAAANGPKTNEAGIRIQYTVNPAGSALAE